MTPTRSLPSSPSAPTAKRDAAASTEPGVAWFSATARCGSGTSPTSSSPARSRSWTCITPRDTSGDVAKAIYGAGSDLAEQWAKQRRDELDEGKIDAILTALRVHAETNDEVRKCLDRIARNQKRMRYPEFRAQGLCVSSGVVEAGCKVVIGTRLKRAGMHWTLAGADAITALRCCKLSGRFEDFWERRSAATRAPAGGAR